MINVLYVPFVGIPLAIMLFMVGLMLCCTIVLIPVGLTCFALAFRFIALQPRR